MMTAVAPLSVTVGSASITSGRSLAKLSKPPPKKVSACAHRDTDADARAHNQSGLGAIVEAIPEEGQRRRL